MDEQKVREKSDAAESSALASLRPQVVIREELLEVMAGNIKLHF